MELLRFPPLRPMIAALVFGGALAFGPGALEAAPSGDLQAVHPIPLGYSVKNPLTGWRGRREIKPWKGETVLIHPADRDFESLKKWYIGWNEIENAQSDGPERIKAYLDEQWKDLPGRNDKAIPRIVIIDHNGRYIPADLPDMKDPRESPWYTSAVVQARIQRLIERLGKLMDRDPRVAYVEMGIQGKYGEHWALEKMPEFATWLYGQFAANFKNKKVMVRNVGTPGFGSDTAILKKLAADFPFGFYQDSFGYAMYRSSIDAVAKLDDGRRWEQAVMGGEIRTWKNPLMEVSNLETNLSGEPLKLLVNWTRFGHFNHMGWDGNQFILEGRGLPGGEAMRQALGYHFVIPEFRFKARVKAGDNLPFSFTVKNTGSAPFYYDWPVQIALVDEGTRTTRASMRMPEAQISKILPGIDWDEGSQSYRTPPAVVAMSGNLAIPKDLPDGNYLITVAILDPEGGNLPALRFEIENYWKGGLHPMGRVVVGKGTASPALDGKDFFKDPIDGSLHYVVGK